MKKIIAALVAAGMTCADDASEESVAALVNGAITERNGFKTQIEAANSARKNRIEAAVNSAVTDKIVAEGRKVSMIATGCASAEGETVILDQIADLREAKAVRGGRGATPVPRGNPTGEQDSIESLLEQQDDAVAKNDTEALAEINAKLRTARGRKEPLFKPEPLVPARN
jgi:hypothetical protein